MLLITIFDVYSKYLESVQNKNIQPILTSALVRYLVPFWGGPIPKGKRATSEEIYLSKEYLKKLNVELLVDSINTLETIFKQKDIDKQNQKSLRSIYKSFINWVRENNYFYIKNNSSTSSNEQQPFQILKNNFKIKNNYHNGQYKKAYTLMAKTKTGELIFKDDYVNDKLKKEIENFQKYRQSNNCSAATIRIDIKNINRILGWLHRYKNVSLEDLSLTNIIFYQSLKVDLQNMESVSEDYFINYFYKKAINDKQVREIAKENVALVQEYLDFNDGHINSRTKIVLTCIVLAKFIFKDEIDDDEYIDEFDIPVVKRLNQLHNKLNDKAKHSSPKVPYSQKSIPWDSVFPLLEKLRLRANTYLYVGRQKQVRDKTIVYNDLQNFLALAFMVLMPPDRARTFYELEIGRTFIKGAYKNNIFTPQEKLNNQEECKWYIHLQPDDYKTGKTYGEFWGVVHNYEFSDGTLFYDYIEKWIKEGRNYGKECNHNYFFRGDITHKNFNASSWCSKIRNIFAGETGVPVTPKELRKMFVTFLKNCGATEAELEAAAYWQKHSRLMQSNIYNQQTKEDKMIPILEFNKRMFEEINKPPQT